MSKEARKAYMREYVKKNPQKFKRTPAQQAKVNARRREQYATDATVRAAVRSAVKDWQARNPEKRKNQRLRVYGIELADLKDLMGEQNGRCAICGLSDTSKPTVFPVVDHCHKTGAVRGLLCANCNKGLGHFKDDINLLFSAAMYLKRNS